MKALCWIRQSQGTDESVSLSMQREQVTALAADLADDVETLDLGNHTGFSINSAEKTRDDDDRIDANPQVQEALDRLRDGDYQYLVSWDKSRLARDGYVEVIKHACSQGGVDIVFVDEEDDDFARDIRHRAEQEAKQAEIKKSRKAVERRIEQGYWQGAPPVGLRLDDDGQHLEPDDDFSAVIDIIDAKDQGLSHRDAIDKSDLDISPSTVTRILDRRDLYEQHR